MVMEENLNAKNACRTVFFENMRKLSLVNETLRPETETRPRRLTFCPRRDRDVGKMRLETVSRPRRRDRDYIPGIYPWTTYSLSMAYM